jgi:hypothetical protein
VPLATGLLHNPKKCPFRCDDDDDYEVEGDPIISDDDEEVMNNDALAKYPEIASCSLDVQTGETFTKDTFVCDSGASCHFANSLEGMTNLNKHDGQIKIGDGKPMKATMIGTKHAIAMQKDGASQEMLLTDCNYVPDLWVNLFSVGKALKNGYTLSNRGVIVTLQKNKTRLTFDRIFKTGQGFVAGVNLAPKTVRDSAFLGLETKRMTMNAAHSCMTHIGEDSIMD